MTYEAAAKRELASKLVDAIATERFRRLLGPDWRSVAADTAEAVIDALGLKQAEFNTGYSAVLDEDEWFIKEQDRYVKRVFAQFIADNIPLAIEKTRGQMDRHPGLSRLRIRGWVVTKADEAS